MEVAWGGVTSFRGSVLGLRRAAPPFSSLFDVALRPRLAFFTSAPEPTLFCFFLPRSRGLANWRFCLAGRFTGRTTPGHLGDGTGSWALRWSVRGGLSAPFGADWSNPFAGTPFAWPAVCRLLWYVPPWGVGRLLPPDAGAGGVGLCWGARAGALTFCPVPLGSGAYRGPFDGVGKSHLPLLHHFHPPSGRHSHVYPFRDGKVFPPRSQERRRVFVRGGLARGGTLRPTRVYHSALGSPYVSFYGEPDHMCLELANLVQWLSQGVYPMVKLSGEPPLCPLGRAHFEEGDKCFSCRRHCWYFSGYHVVHQTCADFPALRSGVNVPSFVVQGVH